MARVLVVCYSRSGNTLRVAQELAQRMDADLEVLRDALSTSGWRGYLRALWNARRELPGRIDAPRHDPAGYALTVLGTPVWAWRMTPAVRAYLQQQRGRLRSVGFFVTSGDTDVARIAPALEAVAGRAAAATAGFSARELADPARYESKLQAFMNRLQSAIREQP